MAAQLTTPPACAITALPALCAQWVIDTQRSLREASVDLAMAQDRRLVFTVLEALQARSQVVEAAMCQALNQALSESGPLAADPGEPSRIDTDLLSLVDESEAEREIEVLRTVQLIGVQAEWEWNQFQCFHAGLMGDTRLQPETNPWRPATFARALSDGTQALGLSTESRALLLRRGGEVLACLLKAFYAEQSARLKAEGVAPLARKAPVHNPAYTPPPRSDLDVTQPGALYQLLQRLPEFASQPAGRPAGNTTAPLPGQALKLLTRLLDQMGSDPDVQPPVQGLIRQLQAPMVRLALKDPQLMQSDRHPAWRLIHELVSGTAGLQPGDEAELGRFMALAQPLVRQIATAGPADTAAYEEALRQLQTHQAEQARAALARHQAQQAALAQAEHRAALLPLLRQQVEAQVGRAAPDLHLAAPLREFLLQDWVAVLAQTMADPAADEASAQRVLGTVDELLASLVRPATLADRERLRQSLPELVQRLQAGMARIRLPAVRREAVLNELMVVHSLHLRAPPRPRPEPSPLELVRQMQDEPVPEPLRHDEAVDTNLGNLPTIPMAYADMQAGPDVEPDAPTPAAPADLAAAWVDALEAQAWCKLFIQGRWATTRLLWRSDNRQFFMFTSRHGGGMHSLTRRALLRLRSEGLATSVEDRSAMQRAVDSLLGDL